MVYRQPDVAFYTVEWWHMYIPGLSESFAKLNAFKDIKLGSKTDNKVGKFDKFNTPQN